MHAPNSVQNETQANHVHATKRMRGARPFVFSNMRAGQGLEDIVHFIEERGGLKA